MTLFILSPGWLETTHIETLHHIACLTFLYQDYCFLNKFYFVNFSPLVSRHCNLTCIVSTLFCWKTQIVKVLYKWPVFSFPQLEFRWADRILFHLNFLKNSQLKGRGQARLLCHYIWWHSTSSRNHLEMNLSFLARGYFSFIFSSSSVRAHISECLSEYCLSQRESINHWEKINFCFVHYRWDALCFLNDVSDKPTQARAGWEQSEKYAWNIENTNLPPPHHPGSRGEINPKWLNFPQTSHLAFVQTVSMSCETKRHLHVWNKGEDKNIYT